MIAAGLRPLEPYRGCQKPWRCVCLGCGTEVTPQYANIRIGQGGCIHCVRRSEADAVQQMRAAGFEPLEPYPGIKGYPGIREPWRCRCLACGEIVTPRLHHILAGGGGCIRCAGKVVDVDAAAAIMRQAGFIPLTRYPGSGVPWPCKCAHCGAVVSPQYGVVRLRQSGCWFCVGRGFDATKPAVVYVVVHEDFGAVKVGIGNADLGRVGRHKKHGWKPVAVIRTRGAAAKSVETAILKWWRKDLGLPVYLGPEDMPQDGWTETAELDAVNIPETIRRIKLLAAG